MLFFRQCCSSAIVKRVLYGSGLLEEMLMGTLLAIGFYVSSTISELSYCRGKQYGFSTSGGGGGDGGGGISHRAKLDR